MYFIFPLGSFFGDVNASHKRKQMASTTLLFDGKEAGEAPDKKHLVSVTITQWGRGRGGIPSHHVNSDMTRMVKFLPSTASKSGQLGLSRLVGQWTLVKINQIFIELLDVSCLRR